MDTLATQLLQKIQQGELSYEDIRAKLDAINAAPSYTIEEERLVLAFLHVLSYKVSEPSEYGPAEIFRCPWCKVEQKESGLCGNCYAQLMAEDTGYRTYQDKLSYKVGQLVKRIFSTLRG